MLLLKKDKIFIENSIRAVLARFGSIFLRRLQSSLSKRFLRLIKFLIGKPRLSNPLRLTARHFQSVSSFFSYIEKDENHSTGQKCIVCTTGVKK